ncbi:MAG: heme biosynthesis protein HemY [Gammaproteobacteria bacterium]|nr:heme biosynthesis protein HemY [Gammaproteobacteria bacterium]
MRFGLLVIVALLAGAFGAHFLMADRGYVLIRFAGYTIESSVPVLLLAVLLLYAALRLLAWLWHAPRNLGAAAARYSERRRGNRFTRGLIAYAEGDWRRGERILGKHAGGSDMPLMHYLTAARAAQLQGASERRDNWLKLAYESTPEATTAVLLTQAELQLAEGQFEETLATLRRIEDRHSDHPQALRLLARLHEQRGDWHELAALLPRLRRRARLPAAELESLTVNTVSRALAQADLDDTALERIWRGLPRALRQDPRLLRARARALIKLGQTERCEQELRRALTKQTWDADLVLLYGELESADPVRQLRRAEQWLENRPEDAQLLLSCGRLAIRNELWGKARSYLETSLGILPRADTYQVYGKLMSHLGYPDRAADAYRSGLSLVAGPGAGIRALEAPPPRDAH